MKNKVGIITLTAVMVFAMAAMSLTGCATEDESHTHDSGAWHTTQAATCTATGTKELRCTSCNKVLGTGTIDALGHNLQPTSNITTPATCEDDGVGELACTRCDYTEDSGVIDKLEHAYPEWTAPTCTVAGNSTRECPDCGHEDTRTTGYAVLGHSFVNYVSNNDETCETDGTETAKCIRFDVCGHDYTRTVISSALGHSFVNYISNNNATCTADGTETAKCVRFDVCGQEDTRTTVNSALGHDWENWSLTTTINSITAVEVARNCSNDPIHIETNTLTIEEYLSSLPDNTAETSYNVPLSLNVLSGNGYSSTPSDLAIAVIAAKKYVNIDLSSSNLTSIGLFSFNNCRYITGIILPDSIESIDLRAFGECNALANITLPDGIKTIGSSAFYYCSRITNIVIPNSVTTIGSMAFYGCHGLTSVTIPSSVTSINGGPFPVCENLKEIIVATDNSEYTSADGVLYNKNKSILIQYPLGKTDTSFAIPNTVTSIADSAFYGSRILTSITIPSTVNSIGFASFCSCVYLTSITIPASVTSIGNQAFDVMTYNLTTVTFEGAVSNFGNNVFPGDLQAKYNESTGTFPWTFTREYNGTVWTKQL